MKKIWLNNKILFKESFFCMLFSFLVLGVVTLLGLNLSFFTPFNNAFKDFSYLDLYYSEKLNESQATVNQDIILVNIDRLNRLEIASVLNILDKQKPAVIGLDVIFKEEKTPAGDSALTQSHKIKNLVTTYSISNFGVVSSSSQIARRSIHRGYSNFNFDPKTSVVRNFQGIKVNNDTTQLSFAGAVSKRFMQSNWTNKLADYLKQERPINFKGNRGNFLILEKEDILYQEAIPIIKDKIVLLGYLGSSDNHKFDIEDKHFTPMNIKFVGKSAPDTFGLVIHANIISMIISDDFISVIPMWILIVLIIVFTYLALTYFIWLSKKQLASYVLRLNILRLLFMVGFVWLSLLLFRNGILFKTAGLIAVAGFSVGLIGYYKKVAHYLYKKLRWNGYLYQD